MHASDPYAGYVSDVTFPDRFHRELSPAWLAHAAVLGGFRAPALTRPFRYLDLGCGFAWSTVINAAAFADAEFHACDLNPAHIDAARRRAAQLGVRNVVFHEASFAALLERDLPAFDFVAMHGVYSWVDAEVRDTVRRLLARHVAEHGIVYVSYNCEPGWSAEAPLRKLMLELARGEGGGDGGGNLDTRARTARAVAAMQRLGNPGMRYFRDNPSAAAALAALANDPLDYLAHEFLNRGWQVHYSVDVADELAGAGLAYAGSATLADNHPMLLMDRQATDAIAALPNPRLRHLAEDFAVNRRFRRDVFVRGARSIDDAPRRLGELPVGCLGELHAIEARIIIPRGTLSVQPDFVADLRALLEAGAMPIGEIAARLGGAGRNPRELVQNLLFLVAGGSLAPFARAGGRVDAGPRRAASPAAAAALNHASDAAATVFVPSEAFGNGVQVGADEAAQALAWLSGRDVARPARLARLGVLHGA